MLRRSTGRAVAVALAFALFFAALFAQFPLRGRLPGNTDTWFAIALSNTYRNVLAALPHGGAATALYPAGNPIRFGESSPGVALIFVGLRSAGFDDVDAYYVLLCLLFSATACAIFFLARRHTRGPGAAVFAALAFCCANFTLANIDDCVIVFFGVAALAAGLFERFLDRRERLRLLYAAAVVGGLQVYFSAYVFLFLTIWLAVLLLFARPGPWKRQGRVAGRPGGGRHLVAATALYLGLAAPFFVFYARAMSAEGFVTVRFFDLLVSSVGSLDPGDLGRALPDNLIYPAGAPYLEGRSAALAEVLYDPAALQASVEDPDFATLVGSFAPATDEAYWVSTRRRAHVGYLIYALAAWSLLTRWRGRTTLIALFAVGLLLALGPLISVAGESIPTLLYPIYQHVEPARLFRVPLRAFFLCLVALCLLAARGIDRLTLRLEHTRPRWARILPWMFCLLFLIENVPVPLQSFSGRRLAEPDARLAAYLEQNDGDRPAVLLHLPSKIGLGYAGAANDLYELNREIVYMNWQTHLRRHSMNGVNGYLPRSRLTVQRLVDRLPDGDALDGLLDLRDRDARLLIAFHPELLLPGEGSVLDELRQSPRLRQLLGGPRTVLFEVLP